MADRIAEIRERLTAALREVGDQEHGRVFELRAPEDVAWLLGRVAELEAARSSAVSNVGEMRLTVNRASLSIAGLNARVEALEAEKTRVVAELRKRADHPGRLEASRAAYRIAADLVERGPS